MQWNDQNKFQKFLKSQHCKMSLHAVENHKMQLIKWFSFRHTPVNISEKLKNFSNYLLSFPDPLNTS